MIGKRPTESILNMSQLGDVEPPTCRVAFVGENRVVAFGRGMPTACMEDQYQATRELVANIEELYGALSETSIDICSQYRDSREASLSLNQKKITAAAWNPILPLAQRISEQFARENPMLYDYVAGCLDTQKQSVPVLQLYYPGWPCEKQHRIPWELFHDGESHDFRDFWGFKYRIQRDLLNRKHMGASINTNLWMAADPSLPKSGFEYRDIYDIWIDNYGIETVDAGVIAGDLKRQLAGVFDNEDIGIIHLACEGEPQGNDLANQYYALIWRGQNLLDSTTLKGVENPGQLVFINACGNTAGAQRAVEVTVNDLLLHGVAAAIVPVAVVNDDSAAAAAPVFYKELSKGRRSISWALHVMRKSFIPRNKQIKQFDLTPLLYIPIGDLERNILNHGRPRG